MYKLFAREQLDDLASRSSPCAAFAPDLWLNKLYYVKVPIRKEATGTTAYHMQPTNSATPNVGGLAFPLVMSKRRPEFV